MRLANTRPTEGGGQFTYMDVIRSLSDMGVDVYVPHIGTHEECMADIFVDFSDFVLHSECRDECIEMLESDSHSVGLLQGGSDEFPIYRASLPMHSSSMGGGDGRGGRRDAVGMTKARGRRGGSRGGNNAKGPSSSSSSSNDEDNAAMRLLNLYNNRRCGGGKGGRTLTTNDIEAYMLGMCNRRARDRGTSRNYDRLGNLMLVMQFGGPTPGQVRHIDNMVPNVQICTYMSRDCPSTIVYEMDDVNVYGDEDGKDVSSSSVTDCASLVEFWRRWAKRRRERDMPYLVGTILTMYGDRDLGTMWHARYFAKWKTMNDQLLCFGRLYHPVKRALGLIVEPGTTLLAGGNEVHSGPPTMGSRMFAFAIGIPEVEDGGGDVKDDVGEGTTSGKDGDDGEENDGEMQYSPVLLHIDFCCILFGILDFEHQERGGDDDVSARRKAKIFLVDVLIDLIRDYPMRQYLIQIDEERVGVRNWLDTVLERLEDGMSTIALAEEVVDSDEILYSPDVMKKRNCRKKKARPKPTRKLGLKG